MTESIGVGDLVDGKYRVLRLIGEGGWGVVFEAENARTLKRVALKVLRTQSSVTPDIQARFEREAQAAGRIGSEHIVEVFDLGSLADGTSYMVMELLAGEELSTHIRNAGTLDPIVAVKLVVQLLDGLGAAHAAGILHRDLKPENLFLVPTRTGEAFVKILDFGISKFSNVPAISATMTGAVLGSPCYMAPEQARGLKQIDARTDLYAVGTVLFECVTGRVPFEGDNFNDLMFRIVLAPRPNPRELVPDLDEALAVMISKAIAAEPADRFQTAGEFRAALADWLDANGIASVRAPELRRAMKQTPRAGDGVALPSGGTPSAQVRVQTPGDPGGRTRREKPEWSEATVAVVSGPVTNATPVASSATLEPSRDGKRKRTIVLAAIAALAVVSALAVQRLRARDHDAAAIAQPTATPASLVPPEPPPPTAPAPPVLAPTSMAVAHDAPDARAAEIDDTAYASAAAPSASARPTPASRTTRAGHGGHDAGAPQVPPTSDAPKPAPPAASAPKPAGTVEGREIRTNL